MRVARRCAGTRSATARRRAARVLGAREGGRPAGWALGRQAWSNASGSGGGRAGRRAGPSVGKARDGAGGRLLILREEVAPLLGIELLRERRRADEIAEQHRQLAALARRGGAVGCG